MDDSFDSIDWPVLANRWGGRHVVGDFHDPHRLEIPHGAITIFVDVPIRAGHGTRNWRVFRARAPFACTDGFELHIRPKSWWTGLRNVSTGDHAFDEAFRVTSNQRRRAAQLLSSEATYRRKQLSGARIRRHLLANRSLHLRIEEPEAWSDDRRFVEGARQLSFERQDPLPRDNADVVAVITLFQLTLDQLVVIGSARDIEPLRR